MFCDDYAALAASIDLDSSFKSIRYPLRVCLDASVVREAAELYGSSSQDVIEVLGVQKLIGSIILRGFRDHCSWCPQTLKVRQPNNPTLPQQSLSCKASTAIVTQPSSSALRRTSSTVPDRHRCCAASSIVLPLRKAAVRSSMSISVQGEPS